MKENDKFFSVKNRFLMSVVKVNIGSGDNLFEKNIKKKTN